MKEQEGRVQKGIDWTTIKNWFRVGDKAVKKALSTPCSEDVVPKDPELVLRNPHMVEFDEETKRRIEQDAMRDVSSKIGW